MAAINGFSLTFSGDFGIAISDSWKPGIDAVQRKVQTIQASLKKEEHHEKQRLSRIAEMVNKQLAVLSRNLPPMLSLRDRVREFGQESLAAEVTPYIQRAQNLEIALTDLKKLIDTELSA